MLTSRTKLLDRKINNRDAKLCVIATEGEETEKQYFSMFNNQKVKVWPLPTGEDHKSAPRQVLNRLDQFKQEHDLGSEDTLWLMMDVDHHRPKRIEVRCKEAVEKGFQLAVSNLCFELWLYLHFADILPEGAKCKEVEAELKTALGGYNKTNVPCERFKPNIQQAVQRAKALHTNPEERWPTSPGSHVYKVVETLWQP